MTPYPRFVGSTETEQSPIADGSRTVNWYVERSENGERLYPTPGFDLFGEVTNTPGRASFSYKSQLFVVMGTGFYEVNSFGTLTLRGTVAVDENPATICTNGDGGGQVFVTSGNNGYIYDLNTTVFSQVRTGATTMGAHLDGYFLALDAATSTVFLSDLLDGTTWDPTQFAQRSIAPDPWVSMKVVDRYLWLFGDSTSEVWYNAGTFPFPFTPHPSGLVQFGCVAPFSPEIVEGTLMWLGRTADGDGHVLQAAGFVPDIVSSFAFNNALQAYGDRSDAIGDTYQDLGHTSYLLTFPSANATWAYDASRNLPIPPPLRWAERGTWDSDAAQFTSSRGVFHAFAFGEHLMLDRESGAIYRMGSQFGVDMDGLPIRRLRRPPALLANMGRVQVSEFELILEAGLGLSMGQGSDPQVSLRISRDGGKTFGSERWRSAGAIGAYQTRVRWLRNGLARRWMPEIVVSDPIPWRLLGALVSAQAQP